MTNLEKATMIADQCLPCNEQFYAGIKAGVVLALEAEEKVIEKARKWDELDEKLRKFYTLVEPEEEKETDDLNFEEYEEEGDLASIGEIAASAFGYL